MTKDDSISNQHSIPNEPGRPEASAGTGGAQPPTASNEQPMSKPSVLWFLVPIVLIALGIFFAR